MRKKLFTFFLALTASVGTLFAVNGTCGANLTWDLTDGVLTISGSGDMTIWEWKRDAPWYSYHESITSVIIGNSVTSIGNYAFDGCTGLTSVTIGNSVTSIGDFAFEYCTGLTFITIPNSVTSIGCTVFYGCTGLTSPIYNALIFVYLPTSYSGAYAIPDGIESIACAAFTDCSSLTSVTIPNSVTSIEGSAFYGCTSLTSVTIPNSVTSIGDYAFAECSSLTSVTIPNSVTSIGDFAFEWCSALTSVTIPNSVTSIGEKAFSSCSSLTSIEIPNSVTTIEEGAFDSCSGLTSVTIPNSVTTIGKEAFRDCYGLTSVTIGNSVTSIGEGAFDKCSCLTSIEIPNSVTCMGEGAFNSCSGLTSITCEADVPPICGKDVFCRVDNSIPVYVQGNSVKAYKAADQWNEFANILPISAEKEDVNGVEVETSESEVSIAWPQVSGAYTYELVIKDKAGNIVCTLVFNAQGQLLSIKFNAPAQNGAPQHTQAAGFAYTVTGLEDGTNYSYSLTAKNESGTILNVEEGTFRTKSYEAVDEVSDGQSRGTKFLRDGQILIQKGDKTFDLRGQEVR